jgi:PaaX-like protein C-terminal domain
LRACGVFASPAWDLGALEQRYEDFIDEFTGLDPATGEDLLRAETRLVHEWRRFPCLDPRLGIGVRLDRIIAKDLGLWDAPSLTYLTAVLGHQVVPSHHGVLG